MANNRIQIKRSVANATVTGLSNGELAFTQASNTLHIGLPDGSGTLRIGGAQYPGTLTNSHALVANATGGIDKVITSNAVVTTLWANGAAGTNGQVLVTDGSAIYWGTGTSGANTQVQFNDSGVANATAGFTFNKVSNTLFVGNTISSTVSTVTGNTASSNTTTGALTVAGGVGVAGRINTADLAAGNDSVYSALTGTTLTTANVFATSTVNASTLSVGGWVVANNSGVFTSGVVNGDIIRVGSNFIANTTRVTVGSGVGFSANGSLGTANQVLRSSGSGIYWSDDVGDISNITAGDGLTGGGNTGDITVSVLANNGIISNTSGVFVFANGSSGLVANATGVHVKTGSGLGFDGTGNLQVTGAISVSDATISGNLTVLGDLVSLNVATLTVEDSIITLAKDQSNSGTFIDALDIGFFGTYGNTANAFVSGLFRDQSDSGIWKLFTSNGAYTNAAIDTANTDAFKLATLQSFLISGGLTTNATSANLIANSSYSISIVANTLTLSTPLAGTSGGTGRSSWTSQDLLVANSSNGIDALALNTTAGYVLQSNGTAIVYDYLDGGTF